MPQHYKDYHGSGCQKTCQRTISDVVQHAVQLGNASKQQDVLATAFQIWGMPQYYNHGSGAISTTARQGLLVSNKSNLETH